MKKYVLFVYDNSTKSWVEHKMSSSLCSLRTFAEMEHKNNGISYANFLFGIKII